MNIRSLCCRSCGAPMEYVTGVRHLKCGSCGAEFLLEGSDALTQVLYNGGILFHAYIPQGWQYTVFADDLATSTNEMKCFGLDLTSDSARMLFFPRAFFRNCNQSGYPINPITLIRSHRLLPAAEYAALRIAEIFPRASNIQVESLEGAIPASAVQQCRTYMERVLGNASQDGGRYQIHFTIDGQRLHGLFGTLLFSKAAPSQEPPKEQTQAQPKAKWDFNFFLQGGILGAKMRGEQVPGFDNLPGMNGLLQGIQGIGGVNWGRGFDVFLVTAEERLRLYESIFDDFLCNVHYGPQYAALQEQERALVQNIQLQGQMQRQQQTFRAQQQLHNTIQQRNDIIMSGYAQRSARMERMQQNYSEANRGVNSYVNTSGDTMEASVRYDHVYQNGSHYAASDANVELGPDWTELRRKD